MNDRRLDDLKRFYFILALFEQNIPGSKSASGKSPVISSKSVSG
jgi:hypothetical protein